MSQSGWLLSEPRSLRLRRRDRTAKRRSHTCTKVPARANARAVVAFARPERHRQSSEARGQMLSIGKLGVGQADYYLQAVGQGIEDYYTGQGEASGRWLGTASAELELSGQVKADALRAVLNGSRPDGSGPLARSGNSQNRVPGFDLTFSA